MSYDPTSIQRQVARLVHQGRTFREIADELLISPRQAERHVETLGKHLTTYPGTARQRISLWVADQRRET